MVRDQKRGGLITVKTDKSILKKCRNYIHFANATKADFKVFLEVYTLKVVISPNSHSTEDLPALIEALYAFISSVRKRTL